MGVLVLFRFVFGDFVAESSSKSPKGKELGKGGSSIDLRLDFGVFDLDDLVDDFLEGFFEPDLCLRSDLADLGVTSLSNFSFDFLDLADLEIEIKASIFRSLSDALDFALCLGLRIASTFLLSSGSDSFDFDFFGVKRASRF